MSAVGEHRGGDVPGRHTAAHPWYLRDTHTETTTLSVHVCVAVGTTIATYALFLLRLDSTQASLGAAYASISTALVGIALIIKNRYPLSAVVVTALVSVFSLATTASFAYALGHFSRERSRRATALVASLTLACLATSTVIQLGSPPNLDVAAAAAVSVVLAASVMWLQIEKNARRASQEQASRAEREQLARELHNRLGRRLSIMNLRLQSLTQSEYVMVEHLEEVTEDLRHAFADLYALVEGRTATDSLSESLILTEELRDLGFDVRYVEDPRVEEVDPQLADLVGVIAHEGLLNAAKYSGPGRINVIVVVNDANSDVEVVVRSPLDHTGSRPGTRSHVGSGFGLPSLKRAARQRGGEVETFSADSEFILHARLPLRSAIPRRKDTPA